VTTPADVLPDTPSDRLPTRHVRVNGQVANDGYDRWTGDALTGLIGQTARVCVDGDWTRTAGTAEVTGASAAPDGRLVLTLAMPAYAAEGAGLRVNDPAPQRLGIGYVLREATIRDNGARRDLRDVGLRTVWSEEHSR
jgi:hypothetical protein